MKELHDIILAYDKAVVQHKQAVLVTVVKVEGSSYRRPGARMLVTEDGHITGAISGGCLEGDALKKAQFAIFQKKNRLEIYDTTHEEDSRIGIQLGCNGIVYLLFEPIDHHNKLNPIHLLKRMAANRRNAVLVTVFSEDKSEHQQGTCAVLNEGDHNTGQFKFAGVDMATVFQSKHSLVKKVELHTTLYQFVSPPIRLIIVGAGNDVQPLADMAFLLGWHIVIADGRPAYATEQRFPKANRVVVTKASDMMSVVQADDQTAVLFMTHNYNYDLEGLQQVMQTNCFYIGMLGPKQKLSKMLDEIAQQGTVLAEPFLQHVYGPVGLDIGAETAEEIALSVIAEIKAVFSGRQGGPLKRRMMSIHARY